MAAFKHVPLIRIILLIETCFSAMSESSRLFLLAGSGQVAVGAAVLSFRKMETVHENVTEIIFS